MAKQNFLAGNYIGKLGDTIGQRWKDKHIVRAYTKPKNPRTPAQQAMRADFKMANQLAQQAMNINGGQGLWDTSKTPEYSQRVGQAMRMLRQGVPPDQALPLYPVAPEQQANVTIASVTSNPNGRIIVKLDGYRQFPIAKFKGTAYYLCNDNSVLKLEEQVDYSFDSNTGDMTIVANAAQPAPFNSFFAVGLDIKAYDANDREIPTIKADWNFFTQGYVAIFSTENYREDLTITGRAYQYPSPARTGLRITALTPIEAEGTLWVYGASYLTRVTNEVGFGGNAAIANAGSLPLEMNSTASWTSTMTGYYGVFWYTYQKDGKVYCHAGFGDLKK